MNVQHRARDGRRTVEVRVHQDTGVRGRGSTRADGRGPSKCLSVHYNPVSRSQPDRAHFPESVTAPARTAADRVTRTVARSQARAGSPATYQRIGSIGRGGGAVSRGRV